MCSLERIQEITRTNEESIEFLRERRILRRMPPSCDVCNSRMTQIKRKDALDGFVWRCPKHKGRKKSIRKGSLIEKSKLTLRQFISVVYAWSLNASGRMAAVMTGLTEKSIVDWYNFCRDVCAHWTRRNPRIVGGGGPCGTNRRNLREESKVQQRTSNPTQMGIRWAGHNNTKRLSSQGS